MPLESNFPPIDPSQEEDLSLQGEQDGVPPMPGELDEEARALLAEVLERAQREGGSYN